MSPRLHAFPSNYKGLLWWYAMSSPRGAFTGLTLSAGAHDNGYTSTLNLLQNEGLLDKVVLLKGYKDLAHEINSLRLPQLEIDGVFIQKKLHTNGKQKAAAAVSAAATGAAATANNKSPKKQPLTPASSESDKARQSGPSTPIAQIVKPATPVKKPRPLDPNQVRGS